MSMNGELTHFLGLQIRQLDSGIFLSQSKYAKNLVKKFGLESASSIRTLMSPNVKLTVDLSRVDRKAQGPLELVSYWSILVPLQATY